MNVDYMLVDMSNILYKAFHVHHAEDSDTIAGIAMHTGLMMLTKYYKKFKPGKTVVVFDRPNWRKEYTQSKKCVSGKVYKGHRRQNMSPKEKERHEMFLEFVAEFENMLKEHTTMCVMAGSLLEADDIMAVFTQMFAGDGFVVELVTSDHDMLQMLEYESCFIHSPHVDGELTLTEYNDDAEYFLFEKCFRGDTGDNVQNAYPKLRKTKIQKAYTDDFEFANLMNHTWVNADGRTMTVKNLYDENRMLMDLRCQPERIRKRAVRTILTAMKTTNKYSNFHFLKFLGKYKLKRISKSIDNFIPLLSH